MGLVSVLKCSESGITSAAAAAVEWPFLSETGVTAARSDGRLVGDGKG